MKINIAKKSIIVVQLLKGKVINFTVIRRRNMAKKMKVTIGGVFNNYFRTLH